MLDVFHGEFTFIKFISTLAFFTTVGLFFCGIPICRQIWKRKDTDEISGAPFLMGVLGGTCWIVYAYLKGDNTVMYVTGTQIGLYSTYTIFYWFMSKKKLGISIKILLLVGICSALVAMAHFFGQKVFHPLGIICTTLNTMDFAAPLSGLRVVIRRRATSTLPLPLCIANFLVSTEWFIYGLLVWDFYLITPNGIGSLLAFAQLILFIVLPRKPKQRPPFIQLFSKIRRCCSTEKDISADVEAIAVVSTEKDPEDKMSLSIDRISHHRWSSRILTNVVGEVENAIQKVQIGEQFAYSHKLDKSADSSDSGCAESAKTLSPEEHRKIEEQIPSNNTEEEEIDTFNENENAFAESAKSMRLSAKHLQKLAATFGGSGAENLELGESGELDSVYGHSVGRHCASAMSESANTDRLSNSGLFRLSRRLSAKIQRTIQQQEQPKKRAGYIGGFGYSLQQHHYRAMHPRTADQEQTDGENDDVPIIVETDEDVASTKHQRFLKRAKSEPSLAAKQHHSKHFQKTQEVKVEEKQANEQEIIKEGEKQETNSVNDDKCLLG